jgi:hypothetical protein
MQKKLAYLVVCIGIVLLYSGCTTDHSADPPTDKIAEQGTTPLPVLALSEQEDIFQGTNSERRLKGQRFVDVRALTPLLTRAQEQAGSTYVAVYSIKDSTGSWYAYYVQELVFSDSSLAGTNGKTTPYIYYQESEDGSPPRVAAAMIPASKKAYHEFDNWIQPQVDTTKAKFKGCSLEIVAPGGYACWEDDPLLGPGGCTYTPPVKEWVCGGGDPVDEPTYNWPTEGGGSGPGGGSDVECDPNAIFPTPECEENPVEQLESLLEQDEFALIEVPCEEIPAWQDLAQLTPPQSVINKLESLGNTFGQISIQNIENAAGTVVNMDYFSVNITNLPNNMSPDEFFTEVRTNLNNFINTDYAEFSPYSAYGYPFDEAYIWNSSNPMGAILSIDIAAPADDGSVVVSAHNFNSWAFTTLRDPLNFTHPVSGNREFGFKQNDDGSYTIFTRGVDRITNRIDNFVATNFLQNPFQDPDALWESFQSSIEDYVNNNNGSASIETPNAFRPDWDEVKDVVLGEKPISSIDGCN